MKNATSILVLLLLSSKTFACDGEAQIIAQISHVKKTMTSCLVFPDENEVRFFSPNQICPLDLSEIFQNGIEVGLVDGHDCRLEEGDVNGVVVRNAAGVLVLE